MVRLRRRLVAGLVVALAVLSTSLRGADAPLPELTGPVSDLAGIIDAESRQQLDQWSRALLAASGDVIVVVTVDSYAPFGDLREYAVKLFENHGRGIGDRGKDNGLLIVLAVREREVWVEVGYGLEGWITDGFAGETSRNAMVPEFRNGRYGPGLVAGVARVATRIAEGRGVVLTGVDVPEPSPRGRNSGRGVPVVFIIIFALMFLGQAATLARRASRLTRRGRRGWSGWSSGVGPFGGSWGGGGFGGRGGRGFGGGGGGFGGFGGGRSGGGGGGGRW
jgi:uncharacterized protein